MNDDKQKLRDKFMRGSRTRITANIKKSDIKIVENFIKDFEDSGPAGLIHVAALSNVIKKPIRITTQDGGKIIFGNERNGEMVEIEFHEPEENSINGKNAYGTEIQITDCKIAVKNDFPTGHWTLPGNKDVDNFHDKNNCLFDAVAFQTGEKSSTLRSSTAKKLHETVDLLLEHVEQLKRSDAKSLMLGGARYVGRNASDAGEILDNSQNRRAYGHGNPGHPRGHASHPSSTDPTGSVENYSRTGWKTGFLSRRDQDYVAHIALTDTTTRMAMEALNKGSTNQAVHLPRRDLNGRNNLPRARSWLNGQPNSEEKDFHDVVLVLRHHANSYKDPNAPVFVQTFYPRL